MILSGYINDSGHRRYGTAHGYIDGHRAVLLAFIGPCLDGMECCHNNGDPLDNRLENLRWDTRQANTIDKINHGKHPYASRQECKNGHPYTPETSYTYTTPAGFHVRVCRICARDRMRKHRHQATTQ